VLVAGRGYRRQSAQGGVVEFSELANHEDNLWVVSAGSPAEPRKLPLDGIQCRTYGLRVRRLDGSR
jgi:hypothetical protein